MMELACTGGLCLHSQQAALKQDEQLDRQLQSIAAAHHGMVALYAHNLKTGQTASIQPDEPVQTASVIKMGILLDAAEQIRAGQASFEEKLVPTHENQVQGSGVLGQLTAPLTLTLRDILHLMVVLIASKNGPVAIAAFTWENADQRWTGDNEAQKTLGKLAEAIVQRWSPGGLDAATFPWENPLPGAAQKQ